MHHILCISTNNVQLTSTVTQPTCPGQIVEFICRVFGEIMSWSSDVYIGGSGNSIQFGFDSTINTTIASQVNNSTLATLVNVTNENGSVVIESKLTIVLSSSNASISCMNGHDNAVKTIDVILSNGMEHINYNVYEVKDYVQLGT